MHDPSRRRKAQRQGREKGCWVYVPLESLRKAGFTEADSEVYYRVWAGLRGSCVVRLYRQP